MAHLNVVRVASWRAILVGSIGLIGLIGLVGAQTASAQSGDLIPTNVIPPGSQTTIPGVPDTLPPPTTAVPAPLPTVAEPEPAPQIASPAPSTLVSVPSVSPPTTKAAKAVAKPGSKAGATPGTNNTGAATRTVIPSLAGPTSIQVDISSQTLFLRKNGRVVRTIHVSTGSGRPYCEKGRCGVARTPRGRFRIYNRISGWKTSYLGQLYSPLYFKGGYAIHGSNSVPRYPASHGCIRVTVANANYLMRAVPNGTPVWVHD